MATTALRPLHYRAPLLPTLVSALSAALLAGVAGLLLSLWLLAAAGAQPHAVASDSMAPAFARGDLIVTQPVTVPRVGDTVTFRRYGRLVTHRIVAEGRVPGTFETRGDANLGNDPWTITAADVTGRVQGVVRRAGTPLLAMESMGGRVLGLILLAGAAIALWWSLPRATRIPARLLHPSAGYAIH